MIQGTMLDVPRLKLMARDTTPLYRLSKLGAQVLNYRELLAVLVGGSRQIEVAERIATHWPTPTKLMSAPTSDIGKIKGVGDSVLARIMAAFELGRLVSIATPDEPVSIKSPGDAAALVQYEMSALEQEELRVILLNTRNHLINIETIYKGSLNTSQVRVGEIFKEAIRRNAASIIVVHNHPSGDPQPSPEDAVITKAINEAGKLMDIELLDHIIIGGLKYVSLKERDMGFK